MKRSLLFIIVFLFIIRGFGQLTGIKNIPGDYSSIGAAIADLNTNGAGNGGVIFNISAGYTETLASRTAGLITTTTGSVSNPITFRKNGSGANPLVTAAVGGTGTTDYIFCIGGTDYVTFDGIDIQENPANITAVTQMEWGYALLRASVTDGTQNAVIKNCTITLVKTNTATCGIYSFRSLYTAPGTAVTATSASGTNSNNGFYNLYINNCFTGMYIYGSAAAAPYTVYDQNNDIGSLGGNTVTNFGGASGTFYGIFGQNENNMIVANNSINGTIAGGTCSGIQLQSTSSASISIYGNTVSIQYNGTNLTFYGIYDAMGTSATTSNNVSVHDNTVTGCTYPNATSGSCYYINIGHGGPACSYYNNIVSNNTYGSTSTTSTGTVYYQYISFFPTTLGTANIYNNTTSNNTRLQSVVGGGITYYNYFSPQSNILNIYNNVCDNNVSATSGTVYGIYNTTTNGTNKSIYGNSFTNLNNANGTTYGFNISGGYNYNIYKNKVQNINGPGAASTITGMYIGQLAGAGNIFVYNNIVGDLKTPAANSVSAIYGIWLFGYPANVMGFYYNTIDVNATSTGTNFGTAALYTSEYPLSVDLRNNIVVNTSVPNGTGKTVASLTTAANLNFLNLASVSNNNLYYAGTPSISNLLFYDGTNALKSLSSYQAMVYPKENLSVTENPPFVATVTPCDFHLKTTVATQCETGGTVFTTPIAVTTDYDGDARYPNSGYPNNLTYPAAAPDLGADEFGGIPADLTAPTIVYTPLLNTSSPSARILTATINDMHGVPTTGAGLPRICWKKNTSGTWAYVTGASAGGNQYTFTFGAGGVLGDTIYYFLVAQDNVVPPNAGCFPFLNAAGFTSNPPAATTPPSNPSYFKIIPPICGSFNVGSGQTYTTLTSAINDINTKELTCPLTLVLMDASYNSETFPITLNPNNGASAVNTLTIKPAAGGNPVISGNSATGILKVNGFDWLVVDGSYNGGSDHHLTIQNTSVSAGTYAVGLFKASGTDPATHITIKNVTLKGGSTSTQGVTAILFDPNGGGYDNCIIGNDSILNVYTGIQYTGNVASAIHNGQITNNIIGGSNVIQYVSGKGIYMQYADNTLISGNEIVGPVMGSTVPYQAGIYIFTGTTNTKIQRNRIHDWYHTPDDGAGAWGIWYQAEGTSVTEISNNEIYNIKSSGAAPGASPNNAYGIFISSGGNVKILHNSIYLSGEVLSSTLMYDASSACIGIYLPGALSNNIEIRNNILKNSMMGLASTGCPLDGKTYAIMTTASDASNFSVINNNDYFVDGCNGKIGFMNFNYLATLSQWQTATGQDANSVNIDPVFSSPTHLVPTATTMNNAGVYISTLPSDIDGTTRSNPPDIGAYEFAPDPLVVTTSATLPTTYGATLNGTINGNTFSVNSFFDYGLTTAYGSTTTGTPSIMSGSVPVPYSAVVGGLLPLTTYHFRARGVTTTSLTGYGQDFTFTTAAIPPLVVTTAATAVNSNSATLNGTVNPNGVSATVSFEYGLSTAYGNSVTATQSPVSGSVVTNVSAPITGLLPFTTYHFRVNSTNNGGTTNGNDMTFTTSAIPALVVTNIASGVGTVTATLNGTVTANNAPTTVTFQWGTTIAYGNTINATPATATGMSPTAVLANLTGLTINTTYHYRCVGVNVAGTTNGLDQIFTTNCLAPVITISGPATGCSGFGGYVYTTQAGNSGYTWNVSAGGTITSGLGTNAITVTWNTAGAQTVSVNYNSPFGCSALSPTIYNVAVNASPVPTITGSANACNLYTNNAYSTQTGMTGYTWTVSSGGTITSGQGTNAIMVTWSSTGAKTVSVNYTNASGCNALVPATFNVTVNPLPSPTITGSTSICANTGYIPYTTEAGMSGYVWSVSAGGSIYSGQGTNAVQVTWNSGGAQTISVNYNNASGCSALNPTVLNVTVNTVPGPAGFITGTPTVCGGAQGVAYSIAPIPGTVTYVWTLPAGATIASGAGTNSITVNFAANASSGNISVSGNNLCGNGTPSPDYALTVTPLPDAAGTITGSSAVCVGTNGIVYSVASIANASTYTWTLPYGATIVSGTNTNTITVDFSMNAASGNVVVYGSNACGNGTASPAFAVTVFPIPPTPVITMNGVTLTSSAMYGNQWYFENNPIQGDTLQTCTATQTGFYWDVVSLHGCTSDSSNHVYVVITGIQNNINEFGVVLYPNPNDGLFTIHISANKPLTMDVMVYNTLGVNIRTLKDLSIQGDYRQSLDLRSEPSGVYTVVLRNSTNSIVKKVVINK